MKLSDSFMNQTNRRGENEALEKCRQILRGPKRKFLLVVLEVLFKVQRDR